MNKAYISEVNGSEKVDPCNCEGTTWAVVARWKAVASFKRLLYFVKIKINSLTLSDLTEHLHSQTFHSYSQLSLLLHSVTIFSKMREDDYRTRGK